MTNSTIPTTDEFMEVMKSFLEPRKRVTFAPMVCSTTPGPLYFEELKELWYDRSALATFKSQAKKVVSQYRQAKDLSGYELRGFEHCTVDRQKRKFMSIQCTVSASQRGVRAEQLASISQRCSAWNSETAFLQACHDYCNVYKPSMANAIPEVMQTPPEFPFVMRKRVVTGDCALERRVRRRCIPVL